MILSFDEKIGATANAGASIGVAAEGGNVPEDQGWFWNWMQSMGEGLGAAARATGLDRSPSEVLTAGILPPSFTNEGWQRNSEIAAGAPNTKVGSTFDKVLMRPSALYQGGLRWGDALQRSQYTPGQSRPWHMTDAQWNRSRNQEFAGADVNLDIRSYIKMAWEGDDTASEVIRALEGHAPTLDKNGMVTYELVDDDSPEGRERKYQDLYERGIRDRFTWGLVDFGYDVVTDPLNAVTLGASKASQVMRTLQPGDVDRAFTMSRQGGQMPQNVELVNDVMKGPNALSPQNVTNSVRGKIADHRVRRLNRLVGQSVDEYIQFSRNGSNLAGTVTRNNPLFDALDDQGVMSAVFKDVWDDVRPGGKTEAAARREMKDAIYAMAGSRQAIRTVKQNYLTTYQSLHNVMEGYEHGLRMDTILAHPRLRQLSLRPSDIYKADGWLKAERNAVENSPKAMRDIMGKMTATRAAGYRLTPEASQQVFDRLKSSEQAWQRALDEATSGQELAYASSGLKNQEAVFASDDIVSEVARQSRGRIQELPGFTQQGLREHANSELAARWGEKPLGHAGIVKAGAFTSPVHIFTGDRIPNAIRLDDPLSNTFVNAAVRRFQREIAKHGRKVGLTEERQRSYVAASNAITSRYAATEGLGSTRGAAERARILEELDDVIAEWLGDAYANPTKTRQEVMAEYLSARRLNADDIADAMATAKNARDTGKPVGWMSQTTGVLRVIDPAIAKNLDEGGLRNVYALPDFTEVRRVFSDRYKRQADVIDYNDVENRIAQSYTPEAYTEAWGQNGTAYVPRSETAVAARTLARNSAETVVASAEFLHRLMLLRPAYAIRNAIESVMRFAVKDGVDAALMVGARAMGNGVRNTARVTQGEADFATESLKAHLELPSLKEQYENLADQIEASRTAMVPGFPASGNGFQIVDVKAPGVGQPAKPVQPETFGKDFALTGDQLRFVRENAKKHFGRTLTEDEVRMLNATAQWVTKGDSFSLRNMGPRQREYFLDQVGKMIRQSPLVGSELHRGFRIDPDSLDDYGAWSKMVDGLKEGDVFETPVWSWTKDRGQAVNYSELDSADAPSTKRVVLDIDGPVRGVELDRLIRTGGSEVLSSGRIQVRSIAEKDGTKVIKARMVNTGTIPANSPDAIDGRRVPNLPESILNQRHLDDESLAAANERLGELFERIQTREALIGEDYETWLEKAVEAGADPEELNKRVQRGSTVLRETSGSSFGITADGMSLPPKVADAYRDVLKDFQDAHGTDVSHEILDGVFGTAKNARLRQLLRELGGTKEVAYSPETHGEYVSAMTRYINTTLAKDPIYLKAMEGRSAEKLADWLRSDPEGSRLFSAFEQDRRGRYAFYGSDPTNAESERPYSPARLEERIREVPTTVKDAARYTLAGPTPAREFDQWDDLASFRKGFQKGHYNKGALNYNVVRPASESRAREVIAANNLARLFYLPALDIRPTRDGNRAVLAVEAEGPAWNAVQDLGVETSTPQQALQSALNRANDREDALYSFAEITKGDVDNQGQAAGLSGKDLERFNAKVNGIIDEILDAEGIERAEGPPLKSRRVPLKSHREPDATHVERYGYQSTPDFDRADAFYEKVREELGYTPDDILDKAEYESLREAGFLRYATPGEYQRNVDEYRGRIRDAGADRELMAALRIKKTVDLLLPFQSTRARFATGGTISEEGAEKLIEVIQRQVEGGAVEKDYRLPALPTQALDETALLGNLGRGGGVGRQSIRRLQESNLERFQQWWFKWAGEQPEVAFSQSPHYRLFWDEEWSKATTGVIAEGDMTVRQINELRKRVAGRARRKVAQYAFDTRQQSAMSGHAATRALLPFFPAWEDSMRKWLKIGSEHPVATLAAARLVASPEKYAPIVTNDQGIIMPNGMVARRNQDGSIGEEFREKREGEGYMVLSLPSWAKRGPLEHQDELRFSVASANVSWGGSPWWLPGSGPLIAIPANQLALHWEGPGREIIESPIGDWVTQGFGLTRGTPLEQAAPNHFNTMAQALESVWGGQSSETAQQKLAIYMNQTMVEWAQDGKDLNDLQGIQAEAESRLRGDLWVRAFGTTVSPFSMSGTPELDWYRQKYLQYIEEYGHDASNKFAEDFPEYAHMGVSLSVNNTGISATSSAYQNALDNRRLVAEAPEWGWAVAGPAGDEAFNSNVYNQQMANTIDASTNVRWREQGDPQTALREARINEGWAAWSAISNDIEAKMEQNGVTSLRSTDPAAVALKDEKEKRFQELSADNRVWWDEFQQGFGSDQPVRFLGYMERNIPKMKGGADRRDLQMVQEYTNLRSQFQQIMALYGITTLPSAAEGVSSSTSIERLALAAAWETVVGQLKAEANPGFDQIYNRVLQYDTLGEAVA